MGKIWAFFRNHYSDMYKAVLFLISLVVLVSFFPKEATFKYEFSKGRPWMHDDFIAPFDFAIYKSADEIEKERNDILNNRELFFTFDINVIEQKREAFIRDFNQLWDIKYQGTEQDETFKKNTLDRGLKILSTIFTKGILQNIPEIENRVPDFRITLVIHNIAEEIKISDLYDIRSAYEKINTMLEQSKDVDKDLLKQLLDDSIVQNVLFNEKVTNAEQSKLLDQISITRGMVQVGERIISKGEVINKNKYQILESLRVDYETKLGGQTNYYMVLAGQVLLVAISLTVLVFFLYFFRKDILMENKKVVLILLIIILMVFITSLALKSGVQYIYLVPLCLAPILIRVFFDTRLALYVYLITIILIGFLVPNSFQFVFMQLISGIITIFSIVNLQKRAQFFFTSVVIFLSYSAIYTGLNLIQEGSFSGIATINYAMFAGSALLILFSYPLIYLLEKIFGMVTDV
nr:hypothetical protein [Bacteroidota bacterium]